MHKICIEYSFIYVPEYREHYGICSGQLQTTVTAIVTVLNTRNKKMLQVTLFAHTKQQYCEQRADGKAIKPP